MERREPVRGERRGRRRVLVDDVAEPIEPTQRRGIERVEVRVDGQQRIHDLAREPIARMQDRRDTVAIPRHRQRGVRRQQCGHARDVVGVYGGEEVCRLGHATRLLRLACMIVRCCN